MSENRTKNAVRNISSGFVNKVVTLFVPFLIRTIIIRTLGAEYLGLSSLFSSILQVLSLAELGFGSAMVFSMYAPIAQDNKIAISALLNLYKMIYRAIGIFILGVGLIFLPFISSVIKGTLPEGLNIYVLYCFFLANTVVSYLLFAYKGSLLIAFQRSDIESNITTVVNVFLYTISIILLLLFKNYYLYVILFPLATIAINLIRSRIVDIKYSEYICFGRVDRTTLLGISKNVQALVGHKIGAIVSNAADTLVISAFFGLSTIAIYSNYYYIISSLSGLMAILYSAITASVGNSIVLETREKNYTDFKKFNFIYILVTSICCVCLTSLYQHFMQIWVGKEYMFDTDMVILFVIYFYVTNIRRIVLLYKDAAGLWRADMVKPYVEGIVNLVSNILLVYFIGIKGIVISTILAMLFVDVPWETNVLFKKLFKTSRVNYYLNLTYYTVITILACFVGYWICGFLPSEGIFFFFVKGVVCFSVALVAFAIGYYQLSEYKDAMKFIGPIFSKQKLKWSKKDEKKMENKKSLS